MEPFVLQQHATGWIEVICGSMFSGKTEELIRRLRRAQIAKQHVEIFKPALDTRYSETEIVSHNQTSIPSIAVRNAQEILEKVGNAQVVGVDEAQFFGADLLPVVQQLANEGKRILIVGLDMDYRGIPFDPMPQLMAIAEYVTKLHAICVGCGAPANHSHRLVSNGDRVLLGATDSYEPRCRTCFYKDRSDQ